MDALTKQERVLEVAKGFRLRYRFASQVAEGGLKRDDILEQTV